MSKTKLLTMVLAVFCALSWLPSIVLADVTIGIFPRRPAAQSAKAYQPLADYLSKELGEKVTLSIPKDFKEFWAAFQAKKYDLVHLNQYHYIRGHKEFGYKVIAANEEFGSAQIAGAIAVRKDSGINSIADLKGKTILFGGSEKAVVSYIANKAILKKAGLEEGRDYKTQFAKNPPSAVIGVYSKAADASGTGNIFMKIKAINSKIDVEQMKVIAETEPFIHLSWAVSGAMPDDKAMKIQKLMTELENSDAGKAVLKAALVEKFVAASDKDYDKVREITKYAIGEDY